MTQFPHKQRLHRFQQHLKSQEAALVSKPIDIHYLTGFPQLAPTEREAFLLIKPKKSFLFHHSFSPILSNKTWLTNIPKTNLENIVLNLRNTKKLLLDEHTLTVAEFNQLKKLTNCSFEALTQHWIWQQRTIKEPPEIKLMKQAGKIAYKVFTEIRQQLKVGMTEQTVANKIIQLILKKQAIGQAFPTIVAFGKNGALPHYQPGTVKLKPETPILLDFGANVDGYYSDMTRTIWFGKQPSKKFLQVEQVVQKAYEQTLLKLKNRRTKSTTKNQPVELTAKDLDGAARGVIANHGFINQFIHTTGHGLGLEIHEPPSLFWQNDALIKPGMIITIEPGIYLPGEFGYRHENTVLVTNKGAKILTTA